MRGATVALGLFAAAVVLDASPAHAAPEPFAWAPKGATAVVRGREAGSRFGVLSLHELTVEIDNVFAAANRQALGLAEQRLAQIPGVRGVYGPSALLDISVDGSGKTRARTVMSRGTSEAEGEAARQRIVRRADALGWFLTENGRQARFYVDTDEWEGVAPKVTAALVTSGLGLASASAQPFEERPLWPDPRGRGRLLPAELAATWVFFSLLAARRARLPFAGAHDGRRRMARALAVAIGAAAPFAIVPVSGVAALGGLAALTAAVIALGGGVVKVGPGRRLSAAVRRRARPRALVIAAMLIVGVGLVVGRRLQVTTRQWSASPMFFVSMRADFDEPVVLREVRRLADRLRAMPGVANAWSVADLFTGVAFAGEEPSRIPDDADEVRRILVQGRSDPAVGLELSGDHHEGLVAVRFDNDPTVDRQVLLAQVEQYLAVELRRSLVHLDLDAPGVAPETRAFGQGLLALDTRERVLRICDRSGRALGPTGAQAVERAARQAATIPAADPARLAAEVGDVVRSFIVKHPFPLPGGELRRLQSTIVALGDRATPDEVRLAVAEAYGPRLPDAILRSTAVTLARQVAGVRRRLVARTAFREMLSGADLPTEGVLADEVRGATAEAMGPVVGLPAVENPGAFKLDAVPIGGVANDRALSVVWNRALPIGMGWAAVLLAMLLAWVGGPSGLSSLPIAFAPLAAAAVPAALLGEPVALPTLAFFAGALAGGTALAFAATAPSPTFTTPTARVSAVRGLGLACLVVLLTTGCGAPPWRMGAPLDGRPAIPARQARRTVPEARAAAAAARAAQQPVLEMAALFELESLDRLNSQERSRLAALLVARAAAFRGLARAIAESVDLERAVRFDPALAGPLTPWRAMAAVAAGDAWKAIRATSEARDAFALAAHLGGVPPATVAPQPTREPVPARPPADIGRWVLAGPALSARVLPLVAAFPWVLDDEPRALSWVPLLLDEDPTSPEVRELVAVIFGRAHRYGGTQRMLMELAYYSPDRPAAYARAASVWEGLGRTREACAEWIHAARLRDDPEDANWIRATECARRDPGAADWREVRNYVLARARLDRREAIAAALDGRPLPPPSPALDGGLDAGTDGAPDAAAEPAMPLDASALDSRQ